MMYDVHIFAVVRLKVEGVQADNQQEAIHQAFQSIDLHAQFDGANTAYADEISSYMVDEVGDAEYGRTQCYLDKCHHELHTLDEKNGVEIIDTAN
jgi:hypothetical protein